MTSDTRTIGRLRGLALVIGLAIAGLFVAPAALAAPAPRTVVVNPGDTIYSDGFRCAVGANVTNGSAVFFVLTADCAQVSETWYADPGETILVGTVVGAGFPNNDYALGRYDAGVTPGHTFTSAGDATVGQSVCIKTSASGLRCGTVVAVNVTVNTGSTILTGLVQTNICGDGALSGTPLFSGSTALGILVTSSGSCAGGGSTFSQPISEVLAAYGVTIY